MGEAGMVYIFENALKKIRNAKLQRNNFYEKKDIEFSKNILEKVNKTRQVKGKYGKYIKIFVETLINKQANFNFNIFMRNIRKLSIVITDDYLENADGWFIIAENKIYINKEQLPQIEEIIYHELFHMASGYITRKKAVSGFRYGKLGNGIDEGYTQLLTNRYFKEDLEAYGIETKIAFLLEFIVGKSLMEKMYSQGNAIGLINVIRKYAKNNELHAWLFLKQLDKFEEINALPFDEFTLDKLEEVINILRNIMLNLIGLFINKITLEKSGDIEEFFSNLICDASAKNQNYVILNQKEIEQYKEKCYEIINENKQYK